MAHERVQVCSGFQLVFGLRWFPVLGASSTQQARLLCKRHRAKAWVVTGRHFSSVGLSSKKLTAKTQRVAAAVCFATLFPRGVQAAIYKLDQQCYWLIAAHEGVPLRHGDMVFSSIEQAKQRAQQLAKHHTSLVLQPDILSIESLVPLLTTRMRLKAKMLPKRQRPWAWFTVVSLVVSLAYWSYVPRVSVAAVDPEPLRDPYQAYWDQQQRPASHYVALQALLEHWQALPLDVASWRLNGSNCQVQRAFWQCTHSFKPEVEMATVVDFQKKQPTDWQMIQADLQKIHVQTQVYFQDQEPRRWYTSQAIQAKLLAKFQSLKPAFQSIKLLTPVQFLGKGQTTSATSGIGLPQHQFAPIFEQGVALQAPLRSLSLLLDFDEYVHWEKASFVLNQKQKASLKQSAVQAQLHGVAYVRD